MADICAKCGHEVRFRAAAYERGGVWKHRICTTRPHERCHKKMLKTSRRLYKTDPIATLKANFLDPESYVAWDGREILGDQDWGPRAREVMERDKGMCQGCVPSHFIGEMGEAHHILSKGKHPHDDRLSNLEWVCRTSHRKIHNREPKWTPKGAEGGISRLEFFLLVISLQLAAITAILLGMQRR